VKNIATGDETAADKSLMGAQALSDVGTATTTAATGATQGASVGWGFARAAAPALSKVAGPVAMARGGLDIVRGIGQTGLAAYRRKKLKALEDFQGKHEGVARFAKQTQTTRAVSGVGTAIGGGLALAGGLGIAGLALSNPVGWALLGGAAVVGGGVAAYKKIRKHQLGKQINTDEYRKKLERAGIHVPDDEDLAPRSTWQKAKNLFTASSTSQRRYEAVRGHIAQKLSKNEDSHGFEHSSELEEIASHMGIKPRKPRALDPHAPLRVSDDAREKERARRAKNYARALDA
jgi:hypothetical protein